MNHTGTQTITTDRLILRRFTLADAESVRRNWAGDEQVQNDYGEPAYETPKAARELLERYINAYEKSEIYRWGIFLKNENDNCIGQAAFFIVDSKNEFCEIEYCIGRDYQNKGYTTEAVKAIKAYGFDTVGFNRIQVSCRHVNIPSKRVIEKCGFTYEGTLRRFFNHLGEFHDRLYYSMLSDEWVDQREITYYNSLPFEFDDFIELPELHDGTIYLVCTEKRPAMPEKKWVPGYHFAICKGGEKAGYIDLRIGYTDGLYYGGHIGYGIDENHRGNGYAVRACRLLKPVAKAHKMTKLLITNNITNTASQRVCEKLRARFVRIVRLPEWHDLYKNGARFANIFEWSME